METQKVKWLSQSHNRLVEEQEPEPVFLLNYTMKKKLFFSDLKSDYSLEKMLYLHLTFVNIKNWNAELTVTML